MSAAVKQIVTVGAGGVVEVRSPELREGDQAQVTVVVLAAVDRPQTTGLAGGWRRYAGALTGMDTRAGDNERIDADLATEHGERSNAGA